MNGGDNRLDFFTHSGGLVPILTVNGTKVGIGNAAPAQALDVNGNIRVGSSLIFSNGTTQATASNLTGVLAGSGLVGGGTVGTVSLSVDGTVVRNNTSPTFSGWVQANGAFSSFLGLNGAIIGQVPNGITAWLANHNNVPGIGTGDIIQGHGVNNVRVFRVDKSVVYSHSTATLQRGSISLNRSGLLVSGQATKQETYSRYQRHQMDALLR
jgi:hypothetical protein